MFTDPSKNISQFGLMPGMKVADLGVGSGYYAIEAARIVGSAGRMYAVDIQEPLLEMVKRKARDARLSNVDVIWGDIEKVNGTTLRDSFLDAAIASNILFQINDKDAFCTEIKRILKPSGILCLIDWSDSQNKLGPHPSKVVSARI